MLRAIVKEIALKSFEASIKIKPDFSEPYINIGNLFKDHLDKPEDAIKFYEKGIELKNIEISNNSYGKPTILLKGNLPKYLKKKLKNKKYDIHLSLSDDKPWAQATVIISYNK